MWMCVHERMGGEKEKKEKKKIIVKPVFTCTLKLFMNIQWINVNKKMSFSTLLKA